MLYKGRMKSNVSNFVTHQRMAVLMHCNLGHVL